MGGEVRWRAFDGFDAFSAAAATFQTTQPTGIGHTFSADLEMRRGWLSAGLRGMVRDDLVYFQRRLLLSLQATL